MAGRRHAATAFRPSAPAGPGRAPSRVQLIALLTGLVVVAAGIAIASFAVKPSKARSFDLFYGTVFLNDDVAPVGVDLASGKPTVQLANAVKAVSGTTTANLDVYPLAGGNTLMVNPASGAFNMVDSTGFVTKTTGGGVLLPKTSTATSSTAVAAGSSAYLVRTGVGQTSIYLVGTATVSAAVGPNANAKARAYATLNRPLADQAAAPAVSANGSLWLLTGPQSAQTVTELSVPPGSNAGASLTSTAHGIVSGVAALGTATRSSDGTGGDVPALATATGIEVFSAPTPVRRSVSIGAPVDAILPATNAQGRLVFLYHSSAGWSEVTASVTGSGPARVTRLSAVAPSSRLAVPAQSGNRTYTIDKDTGRLWQIGADGAEPIPGASSYPFRAQETRQLREPSVYARDSRVIFNNRSSSLAEVVFSDGSHAPRVIDKQSAVRVDPTGAAALADAPAAGRTATGKSHQPPTKTRRNPAQTVNDKISCKTTHAPPHQPTLIPGERAARSIEVRWSYPTFSQDDCVPSTYVVTIKVVTPGAPSAPSQITVQGQDGVTLTHLFPATEYELTVAAYINSQHTDSLPVRVTTGPEGPAAPTDVRAGTDSSGNWTVSWNSCGGVQAGCVPSSTWYVVPQFCDGRGLSGTPSRVIVAGDPTQHSFSTTYAGSDALLGRGLCFQVQGVSPQGTVGDISAPTPVAYSWVPPDVGALTIDASQPPPTTLGSSASTRIDLGLGTDPVRTVGGVGARITFTLNTPQGAKTQTTTFDGTSQHVSASFPGIQAGAQYTATASVAPPQHPGSAVSTREVTVTTRANWPQLQANAVCQPNPGPITTSCDLTVRITGVSSAATSGERFDASGELRCSNWATDLGRTDFDPGTGAITHDNISLFTASGPCDVSLALVESAGDPEPKVFGGAQSGPVGTTVDLGGPTRLDAGEGDFAVDWSTDNGSSGVVRYTGGHSDAEVADLADRWQETLRAPDGTACGSRTDPPTHSGIDIAVTASCVNDFGDQNGWTINVAYFDKNSTTGHLDGPYTLNGGPPNYIPCTVAPTNFSAAWASDATVNITITPGGADLRGCSNWDFAVKDVTQTVCGHSTQDPQNGDFGIPVDPACTPTPGYTVVITYQDPAGRPQTIGPVPVDGTPPSPTPSPAGT